MKYNVPKLNIKHVELREMRDQKGNATVRLLGTFQSLNDNYEVGKEKNAYDGLTVIQEVRTVGMSLGVLTLNSQDMTELREKALAFAQKLSFGDTAKADQDVVEYSYIEENGNRLFAHVLDKDLKDTIKDLSL